MKITLDSPPKDNGTAISQQFQASSRVGTNSPETKKAPQQIPVLDGIRAIACLIVLSYHMSILAHDYGILSPLQSTNQLAVIVTSFGAFFAQFGESGVILFFVLSGFLLFLPYAKALLIESPWPSPRRYYLRRIFRILPSYYVTLLLIISFFHPEFLNPDHWHDVWTFLTFNMSLDLSAQVNIPFWTLAIEFQFYLLLPILARLFSLIVPRGTLGWRIRKLTMCLLLLAAWGVLTRYWGLDLVNTRQIDFVLPHAISAALKPHIYGDTGKYFDVFTVGMFLAMLYISMQYTSSKAYWKVWIRRSNWLILTAGLALLVILPRQHMSSLSYREYNPTLSFFDPHIPPLVVDWMQWQVIGYSIGYAFCLWALLSGTARLKRPFEGSLLRWFGSISFSLYMWHLPFMFLFVYAIVHNIRHQNWNPIVQYSLFWCWTLVVIIPISAAFYRWIEKPGIRLGEFLIAATRTWEKGISTAALQAQASLVDARTEARTRAYTNGQFKGQLGVKEVRSSIPRIRLVPLK